MTVTTGSHVLRSEARAAPTRGKPARNVEMAIIVGMRASASTTSQPLLEAGSFSSPWPSAMAEKAIPAPDMMTALAPTAGTRFMTFSLNRMYAV